MVTRLRILQGVAVMIPLVVAILVAWTLDESPPDGRLLWGGVALVLVAGGLGGLVWAVIDIALDRVRHNPRRWG